MSDPNAAPKAQAIEDVYRQLVKGLGHEHVNDDNVFALIDRAEQDGHTMLAQQLREWQSPCDPGTMNATATAPTAGFNKENVKR
jgi:hypothetical protein